MIIKNKKSKLPRPVFNAEFGKIKVAEKGGKYGYIDKEGVEITPLKYDYAEDFWHDIGWVQLNGKWGAVNKQGEEITPLVYDGYSSGFRHTHYTVRVGDKYGIVCNKTGKQITPIKYDIVFHWYDVDEPVKGFTPEKNFIAKVQTGEKLGCVNDHGIEIIPVEFDEIPLREYRYPFIAVKHAGKWGCYHLNGKELFPPIFDEIKPGRHCIAVQLNGKWGFADENGNKITDFEYDDVIVRFAGSPAIAVVGKGGKFGCINTHGVEITPLIYDSIVPFLEAIVWVQLDGKWGAVNRQGEEVIAPVYDDISIKKRRCYDNRPCIVRLGVKFGYINAGTGKLIIPIKYDQARDWGADITDLAAVQINGKWGLINERGKEVLPLKYEEFPVWMRDISRIAIKFGGKWGFLNNKGNQVKDFEYDEVGEFHDGIARAKKDGKYGFINNKLAVVVGFEYDDCELYFSTTSTFEGKNKQRILPLWVKLDGKYGFINKKGKMIIQPVYDFAKSFESYRNLAAVVMNGKTGFINEAGKTVIPFIYEPDFEAMNNYRFRGSFVNVKFNGKWGMIDAQNRVVIPFLYDRIFDDGIGFLNALRDGKELCIDARGNEWEVNKNPDARTFKDYIHAVEWVDVAKSAVSLHYVNDAYLKIYEENFNTFRNKRHKPFNGIIRIFDNTDKFDCDDRPFVAKMFWAEDRHSYTFFDWDEILDMEVRIEDNLTLTDADVVAACINRACDNGGFTEKSIKRLLDMYADKNYNA